jgi:hypothetical protein
VEKWLRPKLTWAKAGDPTKQTNNSARTMATTQFSVTPNTRAWRDYYITVPEN